jgi:hypothetical protein
MKNINDTLQQIIELETIKEVVPSSVWIKKMSVKTLWKRWLLPKRKKRLLATSEAEM